MQHNGGQAPVQPEGSAALPGPRRPVPHRQKRRLLRGVSVFLGLALFGGAIQSPAACAGGACAAVADSAIHVTATPAVETKFATEAVFRIEASSTAGDITDVQLHYTLQPNGTPTSGRADFQKGPAVQAEYHMRTAGNPLYLPPTKLLKYYWTFVDSAGNQLQTDAGDWTYEDSRFKFKTATNGNLTLYYYSGVDASAQRILQVGKEALDKASALDAAPVDFPVHLVVYGTQAEVTAALSHESKSADPYILGQADPPDIVVLSAGDLRGADNEDTVRHELTHLVNARAVSYSESLPLWLDEGLAVFGQQNPGGFATALRQAIQSDQVVSLKGLSPGFRGANADLFYGEGWGIVRFLVQTYGPEKMAELLATFKSNVSEDAAFTAAYGQNRDGIYNAWRKSVGLQAVAAAAPAATSPPPQRSNSAAPAATGASAPDNSTDGGTAGIQPPAPPTSGLTSASPSNDNVLVVVLAVAGGAGFLAVLVLAVFGGLALSRRGRG